MRTIGIDMGTRRVGVAISDAGGTLAVARTVIERENGDDSHLATVAALVRETGAEVVVVGLPLSLDGSVGPSARWAQDEAAKLAAVLDVAVELHDERLTTVAASRSPAGSRPGHSGRERVPGHSGRERVPGHSGRERVPGHSGRERVPGHSGRERVPGHSGRERVIDIDARAAVIMLQSWLDSKRPEAG